MSTSSRPKPRERVLATASTLFYREGVHPVSIDRLCEEAGVSKRSLYQYFDNKDAILAEMLASRGEALLAPFLAAEDDDRSPRDRIRAVFDGVRALAESPYFRGCPFVNVANELKDPGHPASAECRRFKLDLTAFFRRQAALAGARDPDTLATQLTMLLDGASAHSIVHGGVPESAWLAADALLTAAGAGPGPASG